MKKPKKQTQLNRKQLSGILRMKFNDFRKLVRKAKQKRRSKRQAARAARKVNR